MEEKKDLTRKEKRILAIISFAIIFVLVLGISYAYFMAQDSSAEQTITTGTLSMNFTNGNIVRATGLTPISDRETKTKATELPFSITNVGNKHMKITIKLTDITISEELKNVDFRWGLYNSDTNIGVSFGMFKYTSSEEILLRDVIIDAAEEGKSNNTNNYILRIWIHENNENQSAMMGKSLSAKVTAIGEIVEYTDESCFTFDSSRKTINSYSDSCPKDVVIPRTIGGVTVAEIAYGAFKNKGLTSVIMPDRLQVIGEYAFQSNNLTHITIPQDTVYIYNLAFTSNKLTSVILTENIKSISRQAFSNNSLKTVVIPSNIRNIYSYTLQNNPLEDIVVFDSEIDNSGTIYISTADDLLDIQANTANYSGKTIILKNTIDLEGISWTPISTSLGKFNDTVIDGNGYSIKNMNISSVNIGGFIANNESTVKIKNLTFDNAYVKTNDGSQKYAGVIIGQNYAPVTLEGVNVINSKVENTWQAGGMVGQSIAPLTFKNSIVENTFVGGTNSTSGSFFGLGAINVTIDTCKANNVRLYTDSLTWETTAKNEGNFFVGHLYGNTLTVTNSTETDVTVVSSYEE